METMWKAIAKRTDTVWLVSEDEPAEGEKVPPTARVLDLDQGKLFPPFNTHSILARGDWGAVDEQPDVESMIEGVTRVDERARDDAHDPGSVPGTTGGS